MTRQLALVLIALLWTAPAPAFAQGHAGHQPPPAPPPPSAEADHAQHQHDAGDLPSFIPPLTDADRAAAFPDVPAHHVHDKAVHWFAKLDQLEWRDGDDASGVGWGAKGWVGRDVDRLWLRSEGEVVDGRVEAAEAHVLYGRMVAPWWDVVAGVRQDMRPGPARTWAALGVQGLAPYWFEVEATAYVAASGHTHLRLETEYELLFTNRLVLQPVVEADIYGKADPERHLGAGLSSVHAGLRLRYEIRREFAPYVGVEWERKFFGTADVARADGHKTAGARLVAGVRLWM